MSGPPPYSPPTPRKNNNTLLIVILVCVVVVPCLGLIALGVAGFSFVRNTAFPMAGCMVTVQSAQRAINMYAAEKGTYPKAATWQTDTKDYYAKLIDKSKDKLGPITVGKAGEAWNCDTGDNPTGIAYNSDIAGKKPADIKDKLGTIMLFEVEKPALNAHEPYKKKSDDTSPKILGNPRGWVAIGIEGDVEGIKNSGNTRINID